MYIFHKPLALQSYFITLGLAYYANIGFVGFRFANVVFSHVRSMQGIQDKHL